MPDGRMGAHHPGFPRTPKTDNKTGWAKKGKSCLDYVSNTNYAADRSIGSPFSVSGETQNAAHENRKGRGPG